MIEINPRIYLPATHTVEWTCPRCQTQTEATILILDSIQCPRCQEHWQSEAVDRRKKDRNAA